MRQVFLMMLAIFISSCILAVVADPEPFVLTQPDGREMTVIQRGDEWNNWIETVNGYTIEKKDSGWWIYTGTEQLKQGGLVVGIDDPAGLIKKHYREFIRQVPETARHRLGINVAGSPVSQKILVILVEFSDRSAVGTTAWHWANKVFLDTTNSVADYFDEISYGQFSMIPAGESHGIFNDGVVGWLSLGYNHPNTQGSIDDRNRLLTRDAILAADSYVDFSSFDLNGDGYISITELSIIVIPAGYERAYGPFYLPSVWGHKWSLGWTVAAPVCDGVTVGEYMGANDPRTGGYMQFGEWHQSNAGNGHMATIGIMVHELGHDVFGLPDLYDTDGSSEGIGGFGLMGSGSWGQADTDLYSGISPVHMCGWSKSICGFITPMIATYGSTHYFTEVASAADIYKIMTRKFHEYFMAENRQLSGYDEGLWRYLGDNGGGLAIWHIDESQSNNRNENHKLVDMEEAEGNCEMDCLLNRGDLEDLFRLGYKNAFTNTTVPDSKFYDGTSSGVSITGISNSQTTMSAFISGLAIQLGITRGTERAFIIKKDYCLLTITVDNKVQITVDNYSIFRQTGSGSPVLIDTIPASAIQNLAPYTYLNKYLETGAAYTYIIIANLADGTQIAVSNLVNI